MQLDAGSFLILPCTFEAGIQANFELKALGENLQIRSLVSFSHLPISLSRLIVVLLVMFYVVETHKAGAHMITLQSSWTGASAGGCTNHPTWVKNPRYKLQGQAGGGRVQLLLRLTNGNPIGIG